MPRQEKIDAVAEIKTLFEECSSYFITDYQGLNVADITVLRKDLRENNIRFLVAKNTLLKRAAQAAGQEGIEDHFRGPTAVAFGADDPSVCAKILYDSFKARELPRIKVFHVDDVTYSPEDIKSLADLPSRPVLLSQLVAAIESPLTAVVGALDAVFRDLVGSLDALAEKKKSEN